MGKWVTHVASGDYHLSIYLCGLCVFAYATYRGERVDIYPARPERDLKLETQRGGAGTHKKTFYMGKLKRKCTSRNASSCKLIFCGL